MKLLIPALKALTQNLG